VIWSLANVEMPMQNRIGSQTISSTPNRPRYCRSISSKLFFSVLDFSSELWLACGSDIGTVWIESDPASWSPDLRVWSSFQGTLTVRKIGPVDSVPGEIGCSHATIEATVTSCSSFLPRPPIARRFQRCYKHTKV
jgi:hypothetical protein